MTRNKIYQIVTITSLLFSTACVPLVVGTTAIVGTSIIDERQVGEQIDDSVIVMKVKNQFTNVDNLFSVVGVSVLEGRVLLTGVVQNNEDKQQAAQLAWKVNGVKEVINEVQIGSKELGDSTNDVLVASMARSKLLITPGIVSVNYVLTMENQVLYIIGIAQTQDELDKVLSVVSSVKGVEKVVSHITLKNDKRRASR